MPSSGELIGRLAGLVGGRLLGNPSVLVTDVTHDSRGAAPGSLFVAVRGFERDGHGFAPAAVTAGAEAVVVETELAVSVPQIIVADTRAALAPLAAEVHHHPSRRTTLVGITGTNGKTSVTYLLEAMGRTSGVVTGVMGTIATRVGRDVIPTERTTPEASDFQRTLATMVERGAVLVAAEISSHALALGRVDSTWFEVAGFTNLSQDHLDFHRDLGDYFDAKARLFEPHRTGRAVVWVDDPAGRRLVERIGGSLPVTTVALESPADLTGRVLAEDLSGSLIEIISRGSVAQQARLPLPGRFMVANALMAAGCALEAGIEPDAVFAGLETATAIPGRFEVVSGTDPVTVVVDYAHTPAGIEAVIAAARRLISGRLLVVLGAGGDRDRTKRAPMGRSASRADLVVVTSDNPRSEDPAAIMKDVSAGVEIDLVVEPDRRLAIREALSRAEPGDAVLVLGKGHEPYQEIGGVRHPYRDDVTAAEELARIRGQRP